MSLWLRKHYSLVSEAYILLLVFSPGVLKIKMKYHKNYVTKDKKKETVCVCINEDVAKCSTSTKTDRKCFTNTHKSLKKTSVRPRLVMEHL